MALYYKHFYTSTELKFHLYQCNLIFPNNPCRDAVILKYKLLAISLLLALVSDILLRSGIPTVVGYHTFLV
jgi:hypothetical protein